MRLYDIAAEILTLLSRADDNGELPPDIENRLDDLQIELPHKVDNVLRFAKQCEAEADVYAAEIARLRKLQSAASRTNERLRDYVKDCMELSGITKLDTTLFKLSICKNSTLSIDYDSSTPIPEPYRVVTIELDRAKMVADYKSGAELPDGFTVTQGRHLRVR